MESRVNNRDVWIGHSQTSKASSRFELRQSVKETKTSGTSLQRHQRWLVIDGAPEASLGTCAPHTPHKRYFSKVSILIGERKRWLVYSPLPFSAPSHQTCDLFQFNPFIKKKPKARGDNFVPFISQGHCTKLWMKQLIECSPVRYKARSNHRLGHQTGPGLGRPKFSSWLGQSPLDDVRCCLL